MSSSTLKWLCLPWLICRYTGAVAEVAVITGSTGVLGRCLAKLSVDRGSEVWCGYRDPAKATALQYDLRHSSRAHYFHYDTVHWSTETALPAPLVRQLRSSDQIYLFNNAAVCVEGNSFQTMKESIHVNALAPIRLAISMIGLLSPLCNESALNVVNVSSGEGERVFLHSEVANKLRSISTFDEWDNYITHLLNNYDSEFEYGFGDSPFYSLSKALLNTATRLLHQEYSPHVRAIAVCPGNFISPMSTEEEMLDARSALSVAESVLEMAFDSDRFRSGKFYRFGTEIDW